MQSLLLVEFCYLWSFVTNHNPVLTGLNKMVPEIPLLTCRGPLQVWRPGVKR